MTLEVTLEVFVPGPLRNPMNGPHGHWAKHAKWARQWRERAHGRLLVACRQPGWFWMRQDTEAPKRITFTLVTWNRVDDDALGPMVKPIRDALKDAGLIHDDGPTSGHVFEYAQVVDRAHRGVRITITREATP